MTFFDTLILGIVEGITEFLPISSTAHLEIFQQILQIPASDFMKSFVIAIQLGAILAVVYLYWDKLFSSFIFVRNIIIAFIPTGIIGYILYGFIKSFLLGNILIVASTLILGGVIILLFEYKKGREQEVDISTKAEDMKVKDLLMLGCIQALAVVPGVSRSGAIIIGGRMLGLPKVLITEFSFLLAVPTMLAATAYDLLRSGSNFLNEEWGSIGVGFVVSFVVAFVVIKWLLNYIKSHSFSIFGWYRIGVGLAILCLHFW